MTHVFFTARLDAFARDARHAVRRLVHAPAFTVFTVLVLTIAIGTAVGVFSLLNGLALRDLPVSHPEELVEVATSASGDADVALPLSILREIAREQQVFGTLIAWAGSLEANVHFGGQWSRVNTWFVTGNFYTEAGARAFAGRLIAPVDDDGKGTFVAVAVVGYDYWQRRLGADRAVIGRTIRVEDADFAIIGIAPPHFSGFGLTVEPDLTIPLGARARVERAAAVASDYAGVSIVGRVKPGVTLAQAEAHLRAMWPRVKEAAVPATYNAAQRTEFLDLPLVVSSAAKGADKTFRSAFASMLTLALTAALLLLIVGCLNLAALMLARVAARHREWIVRAALGASRWQMARGVLIECFVLTIAGASAAFPVASAGIVAFRQWMLSGDDPMTVPLAVAPDVRVLAFVALIVVMVGLLVSAGAILWQTRYRQTLATSMNTATSRQRWWPMMVGTQIAVTLVLVAVAGLMVRSLQELRGTRDLHYRRDGIVVVGLAPWPNGYKGLDNDAYQRNLLDRIGAIPGVRSACLGFPPSPNLSNLQPLSVVGGTDELHAQVGSASPGFFRTLEIPVLRGRDFSWRDTSRAPRVLVVSESLARRLFADPSAAIGRHVRIGTARRDQDIEVIGVVADAKMYDFHHPTPLTAYIAQLQAGESASWKALLIQSDAALGDSREIRQAVESFGHEYVAAMRTLTDQIDTDLAPDWLMADLAAGCGSLALLLAAIGLYALLSYVVTAQRRELGVRLALGAEPRRLVAHVAGMGLRVAATGVVVGCLGVSVITRLLASLLEELTSVSPSDPAAIVASAILLLGVSVGACVAPALRASRLDPSVTLREGEA